MPTSRDESRPVTVIPSEWPISTAGLLAAVAGFVDVFAYLRVVPVFVSNQSANLILGGVALGSGDFKSGTTRILSVTTYAAGAAIAWYVASRLSGRQPRKFAFLLLIEFVTLVVLLIAFALRQSGADIVTGYVATYVLVMLAALGMGVQATMVRTSDHVRLLTTGSTGDVTDFGEALARHSMERSSDSWLWVRNLAIVMAGYVAGAAAAAALLRAPIPEWSTLGAPLLVLLVMIVLQRRWFLAREDADR